MVFVNYEGCERCQHCRQWQAWWRVDGKLYCAGCLPPEARAAVDRRRQNFKVFLNNLEGVGRHERRLEQAVQ